MSVPDPLFDEYVFRTMKINQSQKYFISFDLLRGQIEDFNTAKKNLRKGIKKSDFDSYYNTVITQDQCVVEFEFPLVVTTKRVLLNTQGGFTIKKLCNEIHKSYEKILEKEKDWIPNSFKDLVKNHDLILKCLFVYDEPKMPTLDCQVTRVFMGIEQQDINTVEPPQKDKNTEVVVEPQKDATNVVTETTDGIETETPNVPEIEEQVTIIEEDKVTENVPQKKEASKFEIKEKPKRKPAKKGPTKSKKKSNVDDLFGKYS